MLPIAEKSWKYFGKISINKMDNWFNERKTFCLMVEKMFHHRTGFVEHVFLFKFFGGINFSMHIILWYRKWKNFLMTRKLSVMGNLINRLILWTKMRESQKYLVIKPVRAVSTNKIFYFVCWKYFIIKSVQALVYH